MNWLSEMSAAQPVAWAVLVLSVVGALGLVVASLKVRGVGIGIAGVLFAGYLTLNKLVWDVCSFGETCPYLWGYPACLYGLILFATLFLSTLTLSFKEGDCLAKDLFIYTSILGILYSGYFAYQDIFNPICGNNCVYQMGLPTCVYGFVVFTAVFVCMIMYRKK